MVQNNNICKLNVSSLFVFILFLPFASCTKEPVPPATGDNAASQYSEHDWDWGDSNETDTIIKSPVKHK